MFDADPVEVTVPIHSARSRVPSEPTWRGVHPPALPPETPVTVIVDEINLTPSTRVSPTFCGLTDSVARAVASLATSVPTAVMFGVAAAAGPAPTPRAVRHPALRATEATR